MAGQGPSRQELIRRQRQSGFVGRQGELTAFRDALRQSPQEAAQLLFHIHGPAGVGKSTLVRQWESMAREAHALTAYADESVADPVEAMETICAQFAQQGTELKRIEKLLATYWRRRHESDAATTSGGVDPQANGSAGTSQGVTGRAPSPFSVVASQLGLAGLGLIPGAGAIAGAVDPHQIASGVDRTRVTISARLRSHEDVQLALSPLRALTPVFLRDLAEAARRHLWVVLFFDTYELTGPLLDVWLRDVPVSDRYGELPANVLVVLAGQGQLDARCWQDWLDFVNDLPLQVFTDTETRQLLTTKGITDERVVDVILQLSGRLPVLVSTLAETRPASTEDVGDPSGTAVERFLKWETDVQRRAAALACALPRELDEDICRTAVGGEQASELFAWLRSMPFVTDHAGYCRYHDVVRTAMLRLQRRQSPARWREQHTRLADAFAARCTELESASLPASGWWRDEGWRGHRLQEFYHRLCAEPHTALPRTLREVLDAQRYAATTLHRWAQMLVQAGEDTDAPTVRDWGRRLLAALEDSHPGIAVLTLLLSRDGLDTRGRAPAHVLRGRSHHGAGQFDRALADYDRALELDPDNAWTMANRSRAHHGLGQFGRALADLDRAMELDPDNAETVANRGGTHELMGQFDRACADYDRALELDPDDVWAMTNRGVTHWLMGQFDRALADLDRAMELDPDNAWTVTSRGDTHRLMGQYDKALADYSHALRLDPNGQAHYGKAITPQTEQRPNREQDLVHIVERLAQQPTGTALDAVSAKGNLFLAYCAMPWWQHAERCLTEFLSSSPPRGLLTYLLIETDYLVRANPSVVEHMHAFRLLLTDVFDDLANQ
ncbi:tetratricopeptide repeat protein [Streptomyces sp. NPDC057908]|uniref:tetratricopeptide repeat protein n=1 Tax=Streptomyces sp. NPDC057908 TaxID=3346276 RepID=UPI0036ED377B